MEIRKIRERENDDFIGYTVAETEETPPVFQRGTEVNTEELYVTESSRNQGIASALIEQVEHWAAGQGAERVTLSVNRANEPAQNLYRDRGFEIRRHKMDKTIE